MDRTRRGAHVWRVLQLFLTRALLIAVPFAIYFAWRAVAARSGREPGATPWGWLSAAGCLLMGLSLMASVVLRPDTRGAAYVPAEAHPGGRVTPGGFDPAKRPPPASETSPNTAP